MTEAAVQWFKERDRILSPCFLLVVFLVLAYRLLHLINLYAVDLLFMGEWRYYDPLFHGSGWLAMFRQQNGPHREGLGLFVTAPLDAVTGWNMRAESFAIAVIVLAALTAAFVLTKKAMGRLELVGCRPAPDVSDAGTIRDVFRNTSTGAQRAASAPVDALLPGLACAAEISTL